MTEEDRCRAALRRSSRVGQSGTACSMHRCLIRLHTSWCIRPMDAQVSESLGRAGAIRLENSITSGHRILLVGGDHVESCQLLRSFLSLQGHDVRVVGDPREALSAAANFSPDIIFLDLCIPSLNGREVCAILRRSATTKKAAIFGLVECQDMHLPDFSGSFVKPLDLRAVTRVLAGSFETERICQA